MYEKWKVVGEKGDEVVQVLLESSGITVRTGPPSGMMTIPHEGTEEPVTMPKEHAEALAFILENSSIEGFRKAKAVRL